MRTSTLDGIFAVQYTTLTGGALLTAFLLALGATAFEIGLAAALPLLGGLLQPAGAEVIRRRGGRRKGVCLTAGLVDVALWGVAVAAVVWWPLERALAAVLGVLVLQQAATAFVGVAWTSWISDLIPARLRGRYFGTRNFICNAFGAVTALAAGQAVRAGAADPLPVFLLLIAVGAASRLVSLYFLYRQPEPTPDRRAEGRFLSRMRQPLAHPGFSRYVAFAAAWGFAVHLASPFFTVYMLREAGVGVADVMGFAALGTISNLIAQRAWGPLTDRYGDRHIVQATALVVALQPLWWLFTDDTGAGYVLMAVLSATGGFAWGGYALSTGNLMMRLAPELGKTSFFAVQAAFGGLFGALGPFAGGLLADVLADAATRLPGDLLTGFKALFVLSCLLRLGAWSLLFGLPEPTHRDRPRAVLLIRDVARTFNPTQGFSPLLHVFVAAGSGGRKRQRRRTPPTDSDMRRA